MEVKGMECYDCGGTDFRKTGTRFVDKKKIQVYQCNTCGATQTGQEVRGRRLFAQDRKKIK